MNTIYILSSEKEVLGRARSLEKSIQLALERVAEQFVDVAIWRGSELVAAVLAGGQVITLIGDTWKTEDDDVLDLDALGPVNGPWRE